MKRLLILVASFAWGCTLEPLVDTRPIDIDRPAGCNPLGTTDACLYPFPSTFHLADDESSETGFRVSISPEHLPKPVEGSASAPLDASPFELADGFSPVMPFLLHFGRTIDTTDLAGVRSVERSMVEGSMIALFDMTTGERVPHFVEMDANVNDGFPDRNPFIVRPVSPMTMGHRHAVLVRRGLVDDAGKTLAPTPAFEALRDGVATTNDDVEAIRPRTDEVLAFAEEHGYPREELLLAFDTRVASRDWLLGPALSMREEALAFAESELAYTIDEIQDDPNDVTARLVFGTFEVPTYVAEDGTLERDTDALPIRRAENRSYPFTMIIPKRAKTEGPLSLVVIGHGIFGNGRDFLTGGDGEAIQKLAEEFGAVAIATDWVGLSSADLPRIANEVAINLNRINVITDQLQQSLVNTMVMTKLAMGPLKDDASLTFGGSLVDPTRVYYWGASLGGIQGTSFISLSPDIARAAFGVPGGAWTTMLTRSIVFTPVKVFIEAGYPDPLDLAFFTTIVQMRFDHSDPVNVGKLMFEQPLPDAPKDRLCVWQVAIDDSQVPNLASDILIRSVGAKILGETFYDPYGIEPITSLPTTESAVVQYRLDGFDAPSPPETNTAPSGENGVHHAMNFLPNVHAQIASLFLSGQIISTCTGTCDPN